MELIESLENSINALDSCLRVNEKYMTRIEEYQLQAETYAKFDKYVNMHFQIPQILVIELRRSGPLDLSALVVLLFRSMLTR